MEYIIGIILLFTFFGLAYYCIKGHNLMIGFLIITLIWTILPLGGTLFASQAFLESNPVLQFEGAKGLVGILNKIYQSAPEGWGTTLVNVCWGAWFGRVLMETGIASTLIRKTVELGGDKPLGTITLLNIVTAVIFTAMALLSQSALSFFLSLCLWEFRRQLPCSALWVLLQQVFI